MKKKNTKKTISQEAKWVFFILTAMVLVVYMYKKDKQNLKKIIGIEQPTVNIRTEKQFSVATEQQIKEVKEDIKNLEKNIDNKILSIEENQEKLRKRTLLLGVVANENFYILKNKKNPQDFLYINHDWTIDRMPKYIKIPNVEEIEKLLKGN